MSTSRRARGRLAGLTALLTSATVLLAGCIAAPVTATGSGVVTIRWASSTADETSPDYGAAAFNGTYGDRLALCAGTVASCDPDTGPILYYYDPADGDMSAVLSMGTTVSVAGGGTTTLPSGAYTLQAIGFDLPDWERRGALLPILIGPAGTKDLTVWHQSVQRPSETSRCPYGFDPSWAQWPNDSAGGYVCDRQVYAYYPDEPVRAPGWDSAAPQWLQSVGRAGATAPCPEGYDPGWAQWPNEGAGGYVCTTVAD